MWGQKPKPAENPDAPDNPGRLKEAIRQTRIETAERSSVVVDLRDAEVARLELLNEALDSLFAEIPPEIELFDRGISYGDPPRLWVDAIAHVVMGRDKRQYRFVQDTRYGRKVLAESAEIKDIVDAVTHYVASRMIERESALTSQLGDVSDRLRDMGMIWRRRHWRIALVFLAGVLIGGIALFTALWIAASSLPH